MAPPTGRGESEVSGGRSHAVVVAGGDGDHVVRQTVDAGHVRRTLVAGLPATRQRSVRAHGNGAKPGVASPTTQRCRRGNDIEPTRSLRAPPQVTEQRTQAKNCRKQTDGLWTDDG